MTTRRFVTLVMALVVIISVSACSKNSGASTPTGPTSGSSTPTPTATSYTFRVFDGASGAPLSGASIQGSFSTVLTGGDGTAVVASSSASFNFTVTAAGYSTLMDTQKSGTTNLPMWTVMSPNSDMRTKQEVFGDNSGPNNPGLRALIRANGPMTIVVTPDFPADKVLILQQAAQKWSAVTGWPMYVGTMPVAGTGTFTVQLDETLYSRGFLAQTTQYLSSSGFITGGILTFATLDNVSLHTTVHELGHVFGLSHYVGSGPLGDGTSEDYSPADIVNMKMMLLVAPGVTYPYNERTVTSSAAGFGTRVVTIGCR